MAVLRQGLGRRLQQLRRAANLTQEQLAKAANVDVKYLGSIERGEKSASLEVLERLIKSLKVEPYEPFLFSLKEYREAHQIERDVFSNLVRHSDDATRSLLVLLADAVEHWKQARKS